MSLIAIDYDGTYTDDPEAWNKVIQVLQAAGHEVICVTMRYGKSQAKLWRSAETILDLEGVMIYYTGRKAKKPWCEEQGLNVDIWIDDNPFWVVSDSF
jgi:hydroxymethylpyrimidine pyrophosphatase-like HAD family hydrolase